MCTVPLRVADVDPEHVLVDADAADLGSAGRHRADDEVAGRMRRRRLDDRVAQVRRAAPRADARQLRAEDAAAAADDVARAAAGRLVERARRAAALPATGTRARARRATARRWRSAGCSRSVSGDRNDGISVPGMPLLMMSTIERAVGGVAQRRPLQVRVRCRRRRRCRGTRRTARRRSAARRRRRATWRRARPAAARPPSPAAASTAGRAPREWERSVTPSYLASESTVGRARTSGQADRGA